MSEIEVGEYIRLEYGKLDKVKNNDYYMQQYIECEKGLYPRENIVKHSHNILDLIETDDIVILEYYVAKYKQRITRRFEVFRHNNLISFNNIHCDFLYDLNKKEFVDGKGYNVKIKKVLTKEQFSQIEYKVEE